MALATTLQYTESNLIGRLYGAWTSTQTSGYIRWTDKVTGLPRTPNANSRLMVIDKGTSTSPNTSYEIIMLPAASTSVTNDITYYASGIVRGLAFTGSSLADAGNGKAHISNAEIGPVDVHFLTNVIVSTLKGAGDMPQMLVYATEAARDTDNASPADGMYCVVTATKAMYVRINSKWYGTSCPAFANATARDAAIASPVVGMSCYLIAEGYFSDYTSGGWSAGRGTTSVVNATNLVAGKTYLSVAAASAGTPISVGDNDPRMMSTGTVTDLTDGGDTTLHYHASDRARANHTGTQAFSTLLNSGTAGETLSADQHVYRKASDGKLYKATNVSATTGGWNIVGRIVTGGSMDATVTFVPVSTGSEWTTTGLTAESTYYLSTAGTLTATPPAQNTSTTIPVKVGVASSTTTLVYCVERLPRRIMNSISVAYNDATTTIAVGFPVNTVHFWAQVGGGASPAFTSGAAGWYDAISNTQSCVMSLYSENGPDSTGTLDASNALSFADNDGTGTKKGLVSISSNDVLITWTDVSYGQGNPLITYLVTERI